MMSDLTKILILSVICVLGVSGRPKCTVSDAQADECGKKLAFVGEHTIGLPRTDEQVLEHCKTVDEGLQCLKKYSKSCLDPFSTQIMNTVMKNGDKLEARICKDPKGRQDLLHHLGCVSDDKIGELRICVEKFIVQMEHLGNITGDNRIPALCCSFQLLDKCTLDKIHELCKQPETIEYINKLLNEMTGEIVKTGCGKFDSLSHCDNAMDKKEWQMMKDLVATNDIKELQSRRVFSSPFIAAKAIMHKLLDE